MTRSVQIWIAGLFVLVVFGGLVVQKELQLARAESVYVRLAPVDPRSLIQGDYMRLDYELAEAIEEHTGRSRPRRGRVVVRVDERGVAHFARMEPGEEGLGDDERLLGWKRKGARVVVGADAYYFQEGHAERYERAAYAELKVGEEGKTLLVGLRDEELVPIQ
jgi:uncharacterized membrane-anchored protein